MLAEDFFLPDATLWLLFSLTSPSHVFCPDAPLQTLLPEVIFTGLGPQRQLRSQPRRSSLIDENLPDLSRIPDFLFARFFFLLDMVTLVVP